MTRLSGWLAPLALIAACGGSDSSTETPAPTTPATPQTPATTAPTAGAAAGSAAPAGPSQTTSGGPTAPSAAGSGATATPPSTIPTTTPTAPTAPAAGGAPTAAAGSGAAAPTNPADCQGFSFEGLKYSPGGTVLPNKCEPFHPTTNNPYAVRCTDAWPWYKTKFPGDNFCILPPPPDKGVQYGVHPQGAKWFEQVSTGDMSGYEGVSDEWTMEDGEEEQANYQTSATNTEERNYYRAYPRMRPGSHHMIVSSQSQVAMETWGPGNDTGLGALSLPGAQRPDENAPKSLEKPGEDKGLYSRLPVQAPVVFNMHHFNASGQQILKEAWTNLWWEDDATIELKGILGLEFTQVATMAIQPNTVVDYHYSFGITQPIRLVTAFGHRHAWTSNFSTWIEKPDGKLDIVYQSFHWLDEPTYRYDSVTQNPVPAIATQTDGASTGVLTLQPGEKLHFNCHIEYTDQRADSEMAPKPAQIGTLRFANEAFTAEMCILFGSTAATSLGTPGIDTSPLPEFALDPK
ncbi:MAG: hypothetical protein ABW321_23065 [Polyangiales bacterium]